MLPIAYDTWNHMQESGCHDVNHDVIIPLTDLSITPHGWQEPIKQKNSLSTSGYNFVLEQTFSSSSNVSKQKLERHFLASEID